MMNIAAPKDVGKGKGPAPAPLPIGEIPTLSLAPHISKFVKVSVVTGLTTGNKTRHRRGFIELKEVLLQ
jgi:hypothetical protein